MSLAGLSKEEAFMHGWELATQRAISRQELGLPLEYGETRPERLDFKDGVLTATYPDGATWKSDPNVHTVALGFDEVDGVLKDDRVYVVGSVYFEQATTAED